MERYHLWIDGKQEKSSSGEWFETYDPASQLVIAEVARGNAEDIDRAVSAARKAFESSEWQNMLLAERGRIFLRIADILRKESNELSLLESYDNGKPLKQAKIDVEVAARYFEYYAGVTDKILGQTIPVSPGYFDFTKREPFGVCGIIVPWNYPLQIASRAIAPAVAVGNTVVVKPAEETPLTALKLAEICRKAGLPDGVINVVPGFGNEAGAALSSHPKINHLSFTGSVETGSSVMAAAARNIVPVTLELGGKSPNIVFADANLEDSVKYVVNSIIQNAGQTCSAGSRLLVESSIHEQFTQMVIKRMEELKIGPGVQDSDLGPIVSRKQMDRVLSYVEIAREEGAVVRTGGQQVIGRELSNGFFVFPTVFDQVKRGSRVAKEEIFGPVLSVLTFQDIEEAIEIANETEYGLVAGVFTQNVSTAHRMAEKIRAGQIYINTYGVGGGVELPFGGYGKSGFGREKGLEALLHFTQLKNVLMRIY